MGTISHFAPVSVVTLALLFPSLKWLFVWCRMLRNSRNMLATLVWVTEFLQALGSGHAQRTLILLPGAWLCLVGFLPCLMPRQPLGMAGSAGLASSKGA